MLSFGAATFLAVVLAGAALRRAFFRRFSWLRRRRP
jgi:hypothetical protein